MSIPAAQNKRIRVGDILVAQQIITPAQLEQALQDQKTTGRKLGKSLVSLGYVDEDTLLTVLSRQLDIPFIKLRHFDFDPEVVRRLPETLARRFRVAVLREEGDGLLVGMADPTDIFVLDELARSLKAPLKPAVVRESELLDILDLAYNRSEEIASLAGQLDEELESVAVDLAEVITTAGDSDAPVVKLLQAIFEDALKTRASDIHIEPDENVLRIRQRIDGVLSEQVMNEKRIASALVVRLKLLSGLDISERRIPQDGRFNLKMRGRNIDVRVSTMPVQFGESVVMRLLDNSQGVMSLDEVGMPPEMVARFRRVIRRSHGLVLVTGPTGSGKTTTLYGALTELNTPDKKIITVEDPVEYRLPRISQVQVNEKIGLTFGSVLRASLRQDPDILLVGEIRDGESAEIALRAAMTGHLVLSTLHTNDALTSALRLSDMGVDPFLVASSLHAIVAQRLVRRVCENCAEEHQPSPEEQQLLAVAQRSHALEGVRFRMGRGCSHCNNTGYRGRIGVFELLELNRAMSTALRNNDLEAFHRAAHEHRHFRPLSHCALDLAIQGVTSLAEVMRVSALVEDETFGDLR